MAKEEFAFRRFVVRQEGCAMKVGTDGVLLGAWAPTGHRVLDIGTGTGLIALMMAQREPESRITAIDIDELACKQAAANVNNSVFADRIEVSCMDFQHFFPACSTRFDSIVTNPPYFVNSLQAPDKRRTLARHSDSLPFRLLVKGVLRLLAPDGFFSLVLPTNLVAQFHTECVLQGLALLRRTDIKTVEQKEPRRTLLTYGIRVSSATPVLHDCQTLQLPDGTRSPWYASLTNDFYLF